MSQMIVHSTLSLALTLAAGTAQASIYVQPPNTSNYAVSDSSGLNPVLRLADNFQLTADASIGEIDFWGVYANSISAPDPSPDSFTIIIYADSAGLPGAVVFTELVGAVPFFDSTLNSFGRNVYEYSAQLGAPFAATAGQRYWISITNDTGESVNNNGWAWLQGDGPGDHLSLSTDSGANWQTPGLQLSGFEAAFRLSAPSPSTLAAFGMVGLAGLRRRR